MAKTYGETPKTLPKALQGPLITNLQKRLSCTGFAPPCLCLYHREGAKSFYPITSTQRMEKYFQNRAKKRAKLDLQSFWHQTGGLPQKPAKRLASLIIPPYYRLALTYWPIRPLHVPHDDYISKGGKSSSAQTVIAKNGKVLSRKCKIDSISPHCQTVK